MIFNNYNHFKIFSFLNFGKIIHSHVYVVDNGSASLKYRNAFQSLYEQFRISKIDDELFTESYQFLKHFALEKVRSMKDSESTAENLAQETMMKLHLEATNKDKAYLQNCRAWCLRILKNMIIDLYRKKNLISNDNIDDINFTGYTANDGLYELQKEELCNCLENNLDDLEFQIAQLYGVKGFDAFMIAEKLDKKRKNIQNRISSIRKQSLKCLEH